MFTVNAVSTVYETVLSGCISDASAAAAQLRVASIHREGSLPYSPVAGFQVPPPNKMT